MKRPLLSLAALVVATATLLAPAADAGPPSALSPEARRALEAIPRDPEPPKLIQDMHYVVSDEHQPEHFREAITDLGGVFVGVGPEQNYYFAGWARPEVLILLDFDQMVVDLHHAYRVFFLHAKTSAELIDLFAQKNEGQALALLAAAGDGPGDPAAMQAAYKHGRRLIHFRLQNMKARYEATGIPTFLTDQGQYDFVVDLWKSGRVHAVRGDLTGDQAMNGVARAARQLGLPVRGVYLSNVEMYFGYNDGFRNNLTTQPTDDRSLVLRTLYKGDRYERYHSIVQTAADSTAWLQRKDVRRFKDILDKARVQVKKKTWFLPGPPAEKVAVAP